MAQIDEGLFRDWQNNEKLLAEDYKREREILRVAINDTDNKVELMQPEKFEDVKQSIALLGDKVEALDEKQSNLNQMADILNEGLEDIKEDISKVVEETGTAAAFQVDAARTDMSGVKQENLAKRLSTDYNTVSNQLTEKANLSFVTTVLSRAVSGAPKDFYYTLAALRAAYPQGTEGVFLVLADGCIYIWNNTEWQNAGVYQSNPVGTADITDEKLKVATVKPSKLYGTQIYNVFNKATATIGKRITFGNNSTGIVDDANWAISDYETVTPGEKYTVRKSPAVGVTVVVFYDRDKKPIGDIKAIGDYAKQTFTVPTNAFFMRCNVVLDGGIETEMIAVGDTYPSKYYAYMKAKATWLDLDTYDDQLAQIASQRQTMYYRQAITSVTPTSSITFNQNWYGYMNLIKNPTDPIDRVRVYTNVTTANVEYRCRIRNTNRVVLYTATKTPTTTGWQWVEFDFTGTAVIAGTDIYVEVASLNKVSAIVSGATLSSDATATDTFKNYYCNNTNLESYYVVNPANSYYMILEVQKKKNYVLPPDKSITSTMLTDDLKAELKASNEAKADLSVFMPKKVFTWGDGITGDFSGYRVPKIGIYLDHAIPWGTTEANMKGLKFKNTNQKNRIELSTPYPLDWSVANVNDGVTKKEITVSYSIIGDNINTLEGTFVQVSVRNNVGADNVVRLLVIGDSTVEGANAFITLEDGTNVWAPFWHVVAKQFAMDSIEANDTNKYKFVSLGTRTGKGGAGTVDYLGKTRSFVTATGGESGSKLADHLRYVTQKRPSQATWDLLGLGDGTGTDYKDTSAQKDLIAQTVETYTGTEADFNGNPFYDASKVGNNRFSIAKWLERYRTMDDNGNRLTLGNGTGTKITAANLNSINVCTPTHVVLQTGLNDWSQVSVTQYLADMDIFVNEIKTQLPNAKLAITLFADDPGTYFKELYPDIKDAEMRYLHDRTRPLLTALQTKYASSSDVTLLPFYFVMPPAVSLSYRWVQNDDGRKVKVPFGPASNDYHANGYAHIAWAHQLYAWIKSTFA